MKKYHYKTLVAAIIIGMFAGIIDAIVGYVMFGKRPFWDLLIFKVPPQEFYVRTFLFLSFVVFGVILSRYIAELKDLQSTITRAKKEWEETFDVISDAITIHDADFNIIRANRAAEKFLRQPFLKVIGQKCFRTFHGTDAPHEGCPGLNVISSGTPSIVELYDPHIDKHLEIKALPRLDKDNRVVGFVHVVSDISHRIMAEQQLRTISLTDELTGLSNRRGFFSLAEQQIKQSNRQKKGVYLLYADLDGLKAVNDNMGHQEGDLMIRDAAGVLEETFRESDIIARIGGDEFVVFPVAFAGDNTDNILGRMRQNIEKFNAGKKRYYTLSMSTGFSYYDPDSPISLDQLLENADGRMYEQKRLKKTARKTQADMNDISEDRRVAQ